MSVSFLYVPILQTKQNEYAALSELTPNIKQHIKPLFNLTNSEKERRAHALPKQILDRWGDLPCYIDLDTNQDFIINNQYYASWVHDNLYNNGLRNIDLIISLSSSAAMISATKNAIQNYGFGLAIRISITEIDPYTNQKVDSIVQAFNLMYNNVDLIIDYAENVQLNSFLHYQSIQQTLAYLTSGKNFRQVIVSHSSMPKELPRDDYNPHGFVPRIEWQAYELAVKTPNSIPFIFSDYSSVHPEEFESDAPVKPNAKIKYTLHSEYMLVVRYQAHVDGFEQYHDMSDHIVRSGHYLGQHYSSGDQYIHNCSNRTVGTGNFGTWVKVGINHHITLVINQIANQFEISI